MKHKVDLVNQMPDHPDVLEAVHTLMHRVRSRQQRELREIGQDLTHMDTKVLAFFARHPDASSRDLVAHSGRDKGQIARLIGGLRERGLLEASADAADGRTIRLRLTAEGRTLQQALQAQRKRLEKLAVQGLSEAERAQLHQLLQRVADNLAPDA